MRLRGVAALFFLLAQSMTASAVTPQFWENFTQADLLEGVLDHMSVAPDGRLFVSRAYDMVFDTEQPYIFSMVRDKKGNLYVGTGDDGKVYKIDANGNGTLFFEAEEINIFAMAVDSSDRIYVGTSPDGKVYKVTAPNEATVFFDSDDKYIWSMLFDDSDNLYIGTGGGGVIYKVNGDGETTVFYNCADTHVMCLARGETGRLFAGTAPSGLLVRIDPDGKGFTLADTPMEEVHSLAIDPNGSIFAVASSTVGTSIKSSTETKKAQGESIQISTVSVLMGSVIGSRQVANDSVTVSMPGNGKTPAGTRTAVYLISKDGSVETVYSSREQIVFDSVVQSDGSLLLATGPKGRILSVDAFRQVTVLSDTSEEQLTRLIASDKVVYAASSNQGKIYRLEPQNAESGSFESKILDADRISSWGKITWNAVNPLKSDIKFFTRTGNTEKIDNSWSDWSEAYTGPGQQIESPDARYMQWRVTMDQMTSSAGKPLSDLLGGIRIAYLQKNLRPQVTEIVVLPFGVEFQKQPSLTAGSASVSIQATTPDGRSLNAPRERGRNQQTMQPRQVLQPGAQSFTWEATDENKDSLEYSVYFKGESETDWKLIEENYTDTFYTVNAATIPDGIYRLKVVASDAPSNPYNTSLTGELVSSPFIIANTPPEVEISSSDAKEARIEVQFRACVQVGSIATSEFSIDGSKWQLLFPVDGIADSKCEEFHFTTPELQAGEHLLSIRSSNRDGNTGMSKKIIRVP
ncbi:MAG: hypothetical protein P8Z37_07840 [Acidobacteriota bacterium]